MVKHKPEIWSKEGEEFVLLPYKIYEAMREELDDAEDLRLLLESKKRQAGAPMIHDKKGEDPPKGAADEAKKSDGTKTPATKIGETDKADTPERVVVRQVLILTDADPAAISQLKGKRKKKDQ